MEAPDDRDMVAAGAPPEPAEAPGSEPAGRRPQGNRGRAGYTVYAAGFAIFLIIYVVSYGPMVAVFWRYQKFISAATGLTIRNQSRIMDTVYRPLSILYYIPATRPIIFDYPYYCCDKLIPVDPAFLALMARSYEDSFTRRDIYVPPPAAPHTSPP